MDLQAAQRVAWDNKLAKGFNTTDVALEFGLLVAEVGEAFTAWRKSPAGLGEELADIVIYTLALAEMNGLDLGVEVAAKLSANQARVYRQDERGVHVRVGDAS